MQFCKKIIKPFIVAIFNEKDLRSLTKKIVYEQNIYLRFWKTTDRIRI